MSRFTVLTIAALIGGCAHIPPPSVHYRYASLGDYLQQGYSPPEVERFKFFTWETPPQSIQLADKVITFVGDSEGPGYCLRRATLLTKEGHLEEDTFCSLNGLSRLTGYSWGIIAPNGKVLRYETEMRSDNAVPFSGQAWEELEQQFNQLKAQFLRATDKVPGYTEAVRKVSGI
ncbi:MAG: hypothetical protein AABX13_01120 [Nanoarchaeota archaeon]